MQIHLQKNLFDMQYLVYNFGNVPHIGNVTCVMNLSNIEYVTYLFQPTQFFINLTKWFCCVTQTNSKLTAKVLSSVTGMLH